MPQLPFAVTFSGPVLAGQGRRFGRRRAIFAAGSAVLLFGGGAAAWAASRRTGPGPTPPG